MSNMNKAAICADLLDQGPLLHRLSAPVTVISLLALPCIAALPLTITGLEWVAGASVLLGMVELFFALRVRFDAALLRRIGNGLDLADLDDALASLGVRGGTGTTRTLEDRLRGCTRLLVWQAAALLVQMAILLTGGVAMGWSPA